MASETFTFNIAKGRVVEFYNRVENNDPSTSALIVIPMGTGGSAAEGQDADTLAAVEALATFAEEATWGRKTLTDTELAALPAPNDTDNRYDIQIPVVTWLSVPPGNDTTGLLICYDANTGAGTDSDIIPLTHHVFNVTTDGNNVVLTPAQDFFRAS
jgi:hypothetical protein